MKKNDFKPYIIWGVTAFLTIIASISFFFLLFKIQDLTNLGGLIFGILRPIIIGAALAYLLAPVYNWVRSGMIGILGSGKGGKRVASAVGIAVSLIFTFLVIYALIAMIVPEIMSSIEGIVGNYETYITRISNWFYEFFSDNPEYQAYAEEVLLNAQSYIRNWVETVFVPNMSDYMEVFFNLSSSLLKVVNIIKDLAIGLIVTAYLLASKDLFCAQGKKALYSVLKRDHANLVVSKCRYAHHVFGGFISGKILDSAIIGVLCFIGCSILGMPYAMLVSVVVGVTDVIPFFGPFIGAIPCAVLILLSSPIKCVYFCVFILLLQQFDGNILGPKILGDSTGLSSFWVLFSILLFGGLFGFVGMIIGVPLFAVIYSLVNDIVRHGLRRKGLSLNTDDYRELCEITRDGAYHHKVWDRKQEEEAQKAREEAERAADAPSDGNESDGG